MLDSLKTLWNKLTIVQRAALGGVMILVFGGILFAVNMQQGGSYGVLFSNLEAQDAGEVVDKLREMKVDYRLAQGGKAIEVPENRVVDLRLQLAGEGLPREGTIGFEIFDKTTFGATEFTQQINRLRALQGELVRTIKGLEGVKDARVHIALPETKLFQDNSNPATASVVVHLGRGYEMPQKQVAGIVHLVSAAIEGLKPENVSVHDALGELLSVQRDQTNLTSTQMQVQDQYEQRLVRELTQMADGVLGPDKAIVRVHADFNWDQSETSKETFVAAGKNGKGIPTEETLDSESYQRTDNLAAGGAPGVTSPTAAAPSGSAPTPPTSPNKAPGDYINQRTTNKYAVNRTIERRTMAPGEVKRLSVAVLLDSSVPATQVASLKGVFAAAAGVNLAQNDRGDVVELLPMAFDRTAEKKEEEAALAAAKLAASQLQMRNYAAIGIVSVLAVFSLLLTLRLRSPKPAKLDATISDPLPATYGPKGAPLETTPVEIPQPTASGSSAEKPQEVEMMLPPLDLARKLASERPEEVARQLELWMSEG